MTENPSGDSPELENLFDEVLKREHPEILSTDADSAPKEPNQDNQQVLSPAAMASGDTPELQDLFDEIHSKFEEEHKKSERAGSDAGVTHVMSEREVDMFSKVGQLTRRFHDTLRQLGLDESLEKVSHAIPDARDRLQYVATMTESAAAKVLDATDEIQPIQSELENQSRALLVGWQMAFENKMSPEEFKSLSEATFNFLKEVPQKTSRTNDQVMEIVMAQDFQDLTGQVIKRILDMVKVLESSLIDFLVEYSPETIANKNASGLENGPVINISDPEVVTNQQQVDDLLESLGF